MTRRLGEILVDAKVLPEQSIAAALDRQRNGGQRLGTVLVEMGLVDEQTVVAALSEQLEVPVADLRHRDAETDAVALIPEGVARTLIAAPMRLTPGGLEIAVSDPLDAPALARLEETVGVPLLLRLATTEDIRRSVERSYPSAHRRRRQHGAAVSEESGWVSSQSGGEPPLTRTAHTAPWPESLELVAQAAQRGASEVYVDCRGPDVRVSFRVVGRGPVRLLDVDPAVVTAYLAAGLAERFETVLDGRAVRVTPATVAGRDSEWTWLRIRYLERPGRTVDELGMPDEVLRSFCHHVGGTGGLVLVAGHPGSGRSTTLDAAAQWAASAGRCVVIADDADGSPTGPGFRVPSEAPAAWIPGSSPWDVIVLHRLDDDAVARSAVRHGAAAVNVVAAVQAGSPTGAITGLLATGVDRYLTAAVLRAVVWQRRHQGGESTGGSDRPVSGDAQSDASFHLLEVDEVVRSAIRTGVFG